MPTILFTGFPGFIGSALVERVLDRTPPGVTVTCLVQARFHALAAQRANAIMAARPERAGRIVLIDGDITLPDLGLGAAGSAAAQSTTAVYHLAAVYDLGVGREFAHRVNVDGTRHVLDFAGRCPHLERLHYISTCYVSGRHSGVFTEDDLEVGQTFNNFYEETKHAAERLVQERRNDGLPTTIYRPAIVVGDSRTGETQKYDGPYFFLKWLARQPRRALQPVVGNPHTTVMNVVPRDFVVDALAHLSSLPHSVGRVYHLATPQPPTIAELVQHFARLTDRRPINIRLPVWLIELVKRAPGLERLLGVEPEALPYLYHTAQYDTTYTRRDLEGSGISCPPFAAYVDNLAAYWRANPQISHAAMV